MKTSISKFDPNLLAGTLLVTPAVLFFIAAFLNYEVHIPVLWNLVAAYFEQPQNKALGWNANLLIAFGPIAAIVINLPRLLQFRLYRNEDDQWQLSGLVHLSSPRWLVIGAAVFITGVMIAYLLAENCHCF